MLRPLVVIVLTLSASSGAFAKSWYLLDTRNDTCWDAAGAAKMTRQKDVASPGAFADLIRREGRVPTVQVVRNDAGEVVEADIADRGSVLSWFSDSALCFEALKKLERAGQAAHPGELR